MEGFGTVFRWREYTGTDYCGRSYYAPARDHGQEEPPHWQRYKSLLSHYERFAYLFKHGQITEGWQRKSWYIERERSREQLDQLAMQILNPNTIKHDTV